MKEYIDKTAVKAEIEKRIASLESIGSENYLHDNYPEQYAMLVTLKSLKFSLDTLEVKEDVVSNDPLISTELLTASADYARKQLANPDYPTYNDEYELLCAFEAGANWKKEQIMKDAIEREVKEDAGGYPYIDATELYDYENDKPLAKAGDKVKVLIIKDK